jgi:PST family polysaccharide transporter
MVPKFREQSIIYFFAFGTVAGYVYFPVWFFQGMEKMKYMTLVNVLGKTIFTISIFVFIRQKEHYLFVPLIYSAGHLSTALFSLCAVLFVFRVRMVSPSKAEILEQLREGRHIFVSRLSATVYTNSNTFLLGFFTNYETVGYYAAGEKIIRILSSLLVPVYQGFYPFIINKVSVYGRDAFILLKKLFRASLLGALILWMCVFSFSNTIVSLVLGKSFSESLVVLRILSPLIVIIPVAFFFSNMTMLPFKQDHYLSRVYLFGGFINIVFLLCFLVLLDMKAQGAALSNLLTESVLTLMMFFILRRKGLDFWKAKDNFHCSNPVEAER